MLFILISKSYVQQDVLISIQQYIADIISMCLSNKITTDLQQRISQILIKKISRQTWSENTHFQIEKMPIWFLALQLLPLFFHCTCVIARLCIQDRCNHQIGTNSVPSAIHSNGENLEAIKSSWLTETRTAATATTKKVLNETKNELLLVTRASDPTQNPVVGNFLSGNDILKEFICREWHQEVSLWGSALIRGAES